ncbi:MAG: hypothetical protein WCJ09_29470 [Planctomycetota bacterium]
MTILDQLVDPAQAQHLRRLSPRSSTYLQTLVTNFTLTRSDNGLQLRLKIEDDPLTIVDGRGKRDVEQIARSRGSAGLTIDDLPLGLRQHEVVGLQHQSPRQAFERLCEFLAPNLRAAKSRT